MSAGLVPHYQPCLLVWCLTIGHVCWSNTTATDIFTSRVKMEEEWLQVWCYLYKDDITSDTSADPVPLLDVPDCTVQLYQTCMLGSFIQIRVFAKCCSIMHDIWSITKPSDMPTGEVPLPRVCKIYRLPSLMPS